MKTSRYALSWIYGEFRIARFARGAVVESWSPDRPVETMADFRRALAESVERIGSFSRGDISIVHDNNEHTHDLLEVPAMSRRNREKYLARLVERDKTFEGRAAWSYHDVPRSDGSHALLLHLLPRDLVKGVRAVCEARGTVVKRFVPLSEIIAAYLPRFDPAPTDVIMVVAVFNRRTEIIVTLGTGEALFVRALTYGMRSEKIERLATDVMRTLRYTKQQTRARLEDIWILGDIPQHQRDEIESGIDVPVHFHEPSQDPLFWVNQVGVLSDRLLRANFVSSLEQKSITISSVRRLGAFATPTLIAASVLVGLGVELLIRDTRELINTVSAENAELEMTIHEHQNRLAHGREKARHLGQLLASNQNLPSLLMAHLGSLTPEGITLRTAAIRRVDNHWIIELAGETAGGPNGGIDEVVGRLSDFEARLSQQPWNIALQGSWRDGWYDELSKGQVSGQQTLAFEMTGHFR